MTGSNSTGKQVRCGICGYWMMPWLVCEDTDHCSYYDHGDVGP